MLPFQVHTDVKLAMPAEKINNTRYVFFLSNSIITIVIRAQNELKSVNTITYF